MAKQCRLYRDASKRLTLNLEREYPTRAVDAQIVKEALKQHFGATFGKDWEDPLGDSATLAFASGGQGFELDWDHWMGLCIISLLTSGEPNLRHMAEYFDANPPPFGDTKPE